MKPKEYALQHKTDVERHFSLSDAFDVTAQDGR